MMCRVSVMCVTLFPVPFICVTSSSSSESCAVLYVGVAALTNGVWAVIAGFDGKLSPARTNGIGLKAGLDGGVRAWSLSVDGSAFV